MSVRRRDEKRVDERREQKRGVEDVEKRRATYVMRRLAEEKGESARLGLGRR